MALTILDDRASIKAAIATMHPVASEAAQLLAHRLFENPNILSSDEQLGNELLQACAISARRAGIQDASTFEAFFQNHGQSVLNVAASIVVYTIKSERRRRIWGWVGKAGAVAAGIAIGSFFG